MQRLILVALSAALLACGGDGGPTAPGALNLVGTYSGSWFLGVSFPDLGFGQGLSVSCPGSLSITNQSGSNFSGSFVIEPGGGPLPP